MIKNRSIQIFLVVTLYLTFARWLPMEVHQGLYSMSLFIKDLLLWMLPVTIGLFVGHAIACFEKRAPLFVLTLFCFEAFSNAMSVWYSFGCGHVVASLFQKITPSQLIDSFEPLWRLPWVKPSWWSPSKGSFVGIFLGLLAGLGWISLRSLLMAGKKRVEYVLTSFFSRLIPLFVVGFVARMYKTDLLSQMRGQYVDFFFYLLLFFVLYIAFLFFVGGGFSFSIAARQVRHLFPAAGVALSSGCSLSTMPWTIEGVKKNLKNPEMASAVIPATTNIQQIGDCIANTLLCFILYLQLHGHPPSFSLWLSFSSVFVLARFATAAILGGAIFIMLPIYESYLGFTPEIIAIVFALNVILDPFITCANVVANGALCSIFERFWSLLVNLFKIDFKQSV